MDFNIRAKERKKRNIVDDASEQSEIPRSSLSAGNERPHLSSHGMRKYLLGFPQLVVIRVPATHMGSFLKGIEF